MQECADLVHRGWEVYRRVFLASYDHVGLRWEVAPATYAVMRRSGDVVHTAPMTAYSWSTAEVPPVLLLFDIMVRPNEQRGRHELVLVIDA